MFELVPFRRHDELLREFGSLAYQVYAAERGFESPLDSSEFLDEYDGGDTSYCLVRHIITGMVVGGVRIIPMHGAFGNLPCKGELEACGYRFSPRAVEEIESQAHAGEVSRFCYSKQRLDSLGCSLGCVSQHLVAATLLAARLSEVPIRYFYMFADEALRRRILPRCGICLNLLINEKFFYRDRPREFAGQSVVLVESGVESRARTGDRSAWQIFQEASGMFV